MTSPSISTILRAHTRLSITSFDRLYLNGYVPILQTPGQLVTFLRERLGASLPSPALFGLLRERFVQAVQAVVEQQHVPLVHFARKQRKDDVAAWYRARFRAEEGVVFVGVAQEQASWFKATKRTGTQGQVWFEFARQPVAVNHYSFYVQDREWGPAFIKVGSYLPYPVRVCLNGHEWAKQPLRKQGVAFQSLDNGFRWCEAPARVQQVCDALSPTDVQAFFDRWSARLPWPLDAADRLAGYRHKLSLWQVEVSLTQVFAEPAWGRRFFEGVIRENLDLGRPDRVCLAFPTKRTRATPAPRFGYRTRVITRGVAPSLHVDLKHSHVKQYVKEGWALRTETTFNDPTDVQRTKALGTLPHLREVGQRINERLLETERLSLTVAAPPAALVDRVQRPARTGSQRVPAPRLGDTRVLALPRALCQVAPRPTGFRHRELRPLVAQLLGRDLAGYSAGAMTYDLRRLRLHGLIERVPHSFRYTITADGLHLAFGLSRLYARLLQPSWEALLAPATDLLAPLKDALAPLKDALVRLDAALRLLRPVEASPHTRVPEAA